MMRSMWALVFVAAFPVLAPAQEQGWAAKFFPDGLTHNFGNVAYGAQLTFKFPILNIYTVPFQVTEARVSCGCVTPKRPAQIIAPRAKDELEISMDTLKINPPGPKTVSIYVTLTSVPSQPGDKIFSSNCTLTVSCMALGNLRFTPGKVSFGVVQAGQTPQMSLDIEQFGNPAWQVLEVVKNDLPIDATLTPLNQRGRNLYRVAVKMKPTAPAGEFKHELQLKTNDANAQLLSVVIEGVIQAPIAASTNNVNLGTVKLNTAVLRHVVIRGPASGFRITGVDGEGDGIKVTLPDKDKAAVAHVVSIEYTPTKADQLNKTLTFKTDFNGLTATVKVEGKAE